MNEPRISNLINDSIAVGVESCSNKSQDHNLKDSIDFLHFIRYMNIIYKSDINLRLKFLFGVSMQSTQSKIHMYNNIFLAMNSKLELVHKKSETISSIEEQTPSTSKFISYVDELLPTKEQIARQALVKASNQQNATMEQATPSMNQVITFFEFLSCYFINLNLIIIYKG